METYFNIRYEFDKDEIFRLIERQLAEAEASAYICVADGVVVSAVQKDAEYKKVVNGSLLTICDSGYVPLYLRLIYGIRREQYAGSDIFRDLTAMMKYRQCFIGGEQKVLDGLRAEMSKVDPAIEGMMFYELPFCKVEDFDYQDIAVRIEESGAEIIWVALGAPKQEYFMSRLQPYLRHGVMIAVGAVFKFFSGTEVKRAPEWMIKCHLEFVHRLFKEPGKQIGRCAGILAELPGLLSSEIKVKYERNKNRD